MKASEIRYRVYDPVTETLSKPFDLVELITGFVLTTDVLQRGVFARGTGKLDDKDQEIFEGDIKRDEIEEEDGDRRFWYVCTWVKEWGMFAWLECSRLRSNGMLNPACEYNDYTSGRGDATNLDDQMFWSYAFDKQETVHICGNIYTSPEVIKAEDPETDE